MRGGGAMEMWKKQQKEDMLSKTKTHTHTTNLLFDAFE